MSAADRHSRLAELFDAALSIPGPRRDAYLSEACAGDAELLDELRDLLRHHDGGDGSAGALAQPIVDRPIDIRAVIDSTAAASDSSRELPLHIPGYRVLRILGEGGMGVVYLAEQDKPRRQVAIKLMRPGATSPALLKRFDLEQEMLGRLQHPGIAQIFGAGVCKPFGESGPSQPFFAMEFVEGLPLTDYCTQHALGTRHRLRLLVQVCDAVQHAHTKGVVHRDLKPGNILVEQGVAASMHPGAETGAAEQSSTPRSKILDFGVARFTDSDIQATTLHTGIGQIIGTLAYMSPEQAAGDPAKIDARSDIYALGAIGYELLAGQLPHELRGRPVADAARIVRDEEPVALSSLNRFFRGDLDTIFAKALAKEPQRRYSSASEFAADVQRYLDDQPIVARPASAIYNLRKFARRNKGLVAGVALAFVALIAGIVGTTVAMLEARRQRDDAKAAQRAADREAETAQAVTAFLQETLASPDPLARGAHAGDDPRQARVIDVLAGADARLSERFADRPLVEAGVRFALGRTLAHLMEFDAAERNIRAAKTIYDRELGPDDRHSIDAYSALGLLFILQHRFDEAEKIKRDVIELQRRVLGPMHPDTMDEIEQLAIMKNELRDYDGAIVLFNELLQLRTNAPEHDEGEIITTLYNISWAYSQAERFEEALPRAQEVLERRKRLLGDGDVETMSAGQNVAWLYERMNRVEEAERIYRAVIASARTSLPPNDWHLGVFLYNHSSALRKLGRFAEAETCLLEAHDVFDKSFGPDHEKSRLARSGLVKLYVEWGKPDEAAKWRGAAATTASAPASAPSASRPGS